MDKKNGKGQATLPESQTQEEIQKSKPVKRILENEDKYRRELYDVSLELEKFETIFCEIFRYGEPQFTYSIPTAALQFVGKDLTPLKCILNPDFWDSMDTYHRT